MWRGRTTQLLEVRGLKSYFFTRRGVVRAVDGVDLSLRAGETLALVGESGCGKTVTALSILRLLPPRGTVVGGEVLYRGRDLLRLKDEDMRRIRGREIAMIFQEPSASLNPVFTVGYQVQEAVSLHHRVGKAEAMERAIELLRAVGLPDPHLRSRDYPHQLSGGMKQRVMIAMALAGDPSLLIADEPTTALDVTIQAQILDLLQRLKDERGLSMVLITHNLGIVAAYAEDAAVMYAGKVLEYAPVEELIREPLHPYTKGLLESVPRPHSTRLSPIPGNVPNPLEEIPGCPFHPRCSEATARCSEALPPLRAVDGRKVRCWLHG